MQETLVKSGSANAAAGAVGGRRGPELLAPAGDFEAMKAAVANGAGAVYFGLSNFNARHRATNFTTEQLPEVMDYLHAHNVRGFVTFNTLIFSNELEEAVAFTKAIAAANVDAVIVQDLGLARLIHRIAPGLHIHGSTQMTLTEPRGIEFVRKLGVERVVLARELSLDEIGKIRQGTDMPMEVFIHGALCVAYSGQCLTSESLGGRSANRGQCAQACRLPYELIVDGQQLDLGEKAYLLSPQDLAAHDLVGELIKLGVDSFKIEGRLKSAHYVAATTQTYRAAIDAAVGERPFQITKQQEMDLAQSFSRGFTHGFLSGVNHQVLVPARFPKSRGIRVGTVAWVGPESVVVELEARHGAEVLKPGDGVVFDEGHPEQDEQGGRVYETKRRVGERAKGRRGEWIEIAFGRGQVNFSAVAVGALVWKTDDPAIRKRLEHSFSRDTVQRRVAVDVRVYARVNEALVVEMADEAGHVVSVQWDGPLQLAQKFPLTLDVVREQFARLGNTPFELRGVGTTDGKAIPPVMVPKSVLNDLRRQAVEALGAVRGGERRIEIVEPDALERMREEIADFGLPIADLDSVLERPSTVGVVPVPARSAPSCTGGESAIGNRQSAIPSIYVMARTVEQLRHVLAWAPPAGVAFPMVYCDFEDVRGYREAVALAREAGKPIGLATLRVIKPQEHGLLKQIAEARPDAILVRNLAAMSFYGDYFRGDANARAEAEQPFAKLDAPASEGLTPHPNPSTSHCAGSLAQGEREQVPFLVADYALNVANELTAQVLREEGVRRMVPSYDLNWQQLQAMLSRVSPGLFEVTVHQHMPMFHMEHCVFCATLSEGTSYLDCGRPCEKHTVNMRDREGVEHPLIPDVGCRNTVYNGTAQSAAELIPDMLGIGLRHFRVELLRERTPEQVHGLLDRYARAIAGLESGRGTWRQLKVLNQLGVTRGTLGGE